MPFDTPEESLLFDIRHALRTFHTAQPKKKDGAALGAWKDILAGHILAHLLRCGWRLTKAPAQDMGPGALIPRQD
jgi:hypothetical protein